MTKLLTKHQRRTDLGIVIPMEGDYLFVSKDQTKATRLVLSWKEGYYDLLAMGEHGKGKQITPAAARKLFKVQWDIYQRIIT